MSLCFCVCTKFCLCLCSICFTILLHWIGGLGRNSSGRRTSPLVNRRARSLGRSQRKKCLGRPGPGREKGLEIVTIRGMGPGSWVPPYRQISGLFCGWAMHNVHFGYYVYLPSEQAETYLKSCVLMNYSTYICLCLFGWKVNMILKKTVTFKL